MGMISLNSTSGSPAHSAFRSSCTVSHCLSEAKGPAGIADDRMGQRVPHGARKEAFTVLHEGSHTADFTKQSMHGPLEDVERPRQAEDLRTQNRTVQDSSAATSLRTEKETLTGQKLRFGNLNNSGSTLQFMQTGAWDHGARLQRGGCLEMAV